jgi:hypothetical protein
MELKYQSAWIASKVVGTWKSDKIYSLLLLA